MRLRPSLFSKKSVRKRKRQFANEGQDELVQSAFSQLLSQLLQCYLGHSCIIQVSTTEETA